MARRNARSVLGVVLGGDEKDRERAETQTPARRDPRLSVLARCRGYEYVPFNCIANVQSFFGMSEPCRS